MEKFFAKHPRSILLPYDLKDRHQALEEDRFLRDY